MTATAIRASLADVRMVKTRSVLVLSFELPLEQADAALAALGGFPRPEESRWFGIARLQPAPAAEQVDAPKADAARAREARERYAASDEMEQARTRAGLLTKDPQFHAWLVTTRRVEVPYSARNEPEPIAAAYIRAACGVLSRAQIASDEAAFDKFLALETSYRREADIR